MLNYDDDQVKISYAKLVISDGARVLCNLPIECCFSSGWHPLSFHVKQLTVCDHHSPREAVNFIAIIVMELFVPPSMTYMI
jgi:hypothetical protein